MGPTFIKLSQFVSTRSDVFSKDICDELKELQDNVAPVSWNLLKSSIPPNIFSSINEVPIASASICQVHLARIIGNDNDVVIKIKRPNIDEQIRLDFEGLLVFIKWLKLFSNSRRLNEFEILFTEYYNLLLEEVNFIKEVNNMKKFAEMFKDKKWIKIPNVYENYSDNSCITMEYVPAIKIDNIEKLKSLGFNLEKIASKLIECYVDQMLNGDLIHIDCHSSNLNITSTGKIVFYDFGMVLKLDDKIKLYFNDLLIALYDKDIDESTRLIVDIGLVIVEPCKMPYLKKFMIFFLSYIEKMDIKDFKISYIDTLNKSVVSLYYYCVV